jgi:two-component sensor histidine kinase/tetratricopeptide (TPR) repeat protein
MQRFKLPFILCFQTTCRKFFAGLIPFIIIFNLPLPLNAQQCNDPVLDIYYNKSIYYIQTFQALRTLKYTDSVLQIIKKTGQIQCKKALRIQLKRAEALELEKKIEEAMGSYFDINLIAEKNKWWDILALSYISLGGTYEIIGRYAESKTNLNNAKLLIDKYALDTIYADYYIRYASILRLTNQIDSSRNCAEKAVQLGFKYKLTRPVTDGYLLLGLTTSDLDSSILYYRKSVEAFAANNEYHGAASQNLNIAYKLYKAGRFKEAVNELHNSTVLLEKMNEKSKGYFDVKSVIHELYSQIFEHYGQLDSAYYHNKKAFNNHRISDYQINYEKINKNTVDFVIEKEKEKVKNLKTIAVLLQTGLIVSSVSILVFVFLLRNNSRKNKKISTINEVIQQQNDLLEKSLHKQSLLLSEVHHRVKNNLQLVISLLTLKSRDINNPTIKQHLDDVSAKVRGIALIHEQLYSSSEFENINIRAYIENLINQYHQLNDAEKEFECALEINDILLNLETVMPIGIICSELIGNTLKYAVSSEKKLKIHIKIQPLENRFVFKYNDNGNGIPEKEFQMNHSKMGLQLIRNMVRQLQGECKFYNDNGMCFNMVFAEKRVSKI